METSLSLDSLVSQAFTLHQLPFLSACFTPFFFSSNRRKEEDSIFIGNLCNKNEAYFNALIAKLAETSHKYNIKRAENFTGITTGWLLLKRRLQLTTKNDLIFTSLSS